MAWKRLSKWAEAQERTLTMSKNIKNEELLSIITQKVKKLNELADKSTAQLSIIEKQLVDAGVGIEVWGGRIWDEKINWYNEGKEEMEAADHRHYLGFAKVDGDWGFAIKDVITVKSPDRRDFDSDVVVNSETYLLRTASRQLRIDALPHIDKLLENIDQEIGKRIDSLKGSDGQ